MEALFGDVVPPVVLYPAIKPDQYALAHPASFDEREVIDHIELFSNPGDIVFDPMVGSGTTMVACFKTGRASAGIELYPHHVEMVKQRILDVTGAAYVDGKHRLYLKQGDCRDVMPSMKPDIMDLILFSPPYFNILKGGNGERARFRKRIGLAVNYGNSPNDLGNLDDYNAFIAEMGFVYSECYRLLKRGKTMVVIVADIFRNGNFIAYHADTIHAAQSSGFKLRGIQVVMDQWKRKNIYGPPKRPYQCFHHHYALVFEK